MESGTEITSQAPSAPEPTYTPAPAPTQSAPVERTFRQEEVNDIVKRAKHDAVEGFKRISTQQPEYAQQKFGTQPAQQSNATYGEQDVRRMAAEEAQRLRDQWVSDAQTKSEADYAKKIVDQFWSKVNPGKEKYADFDQATDGLEYNRYPNVVQILSEHIDNAHDVLYELGKNRLKMAQIEQTSYLSPNDAIREVRRLAQSIRDNEASSTVKQPNAPLSQQRPSTNGTGTVTEGISVADARRKYRG